MMKMAAGYSHLGCFRDTDNRALSSGPHAFGYSIQDCYDYAVQNGYTYFALQAGDENQGWCCASNSYADATKYGTQTGCTYGTGGVWGNDLYVVAAAETTTTDSPSAEPTQVPTEFHCGAHGCDSNLVCDQATGQCVRDCDVLHIDAFLTECSAEWDENNDTLVAMSASIADNAADIATVTQTAAINTADITTVIATASSNTADISVMDTNITALEADIKSNAEHIAALIIAVSNNTAGSDKNRDLVEEIIRDIEADNSSYHNAIAISENKDEIDAMKQRIEALESTITKLGVYAAEAQSGNLDVGPSEPSGITMTDLVGGGMWSIKDVVITGLVVFNVILVITLYATTRRGVRKVKAVKYAPVARDSDMEDLRR